MKLEDFKAGTLHQRYQYKSFEPTSINCEWYWEDAAINTLLEKATRALGELNAFSQIVPDVDLFIEMHVVKEAQTSSKIEGTKTSVEEALLPEEELTPEKRNDAKEVHNYVKAINQAVKDLVDLPLSNRMLKDTHAILMQGARGEHKCPGEFRSSQNWIGGSGLTDATFIPPHHENVLNLMSDLEQFWHNENIHVPHLIRIAISHYQFETIHPFLDGNGRIGRLMVPLYLINCSLLSKPSLYLSDFFERNRASYYDALTQVRVSDNLNQWIRFFLNGLAETASKGCTVFKQVLLLKTEIEAKIMSLGRRAGKAHEAINYLYRQPVITASLLCEELKVTPPTGNELIKRLIEKDILQELTGLQRDRVYAFSSYLNLFIV